MFDATQPEFISYHSTNRLLVIGTEDELDELLPELGDIFRIRWSPVNKIKASKPGIEILNTDGAIQLAGYLGNFSLASEHQSTFDLVLDFQSKPAISSRLPPFGYFRIANQDDLQAILPELKEMIGIFDKPKYFQLDLNKCAHQQSGITGCHNCIDVCATDAIIAESGEITVNPYLCQGCGDCTSVCPSGAISYQHPPRYEILLALKNKLADKSCLVIFYGGELPDDLPIPLAFLPFQVEALGLVGLDICLTALAFGATQVWLLDSGELTPETQNTLVTVSAQANEILNCLGFTDKLVQLSKPGEFVFHQGLSISKARYQPDTDKRIAIRMATDHLLEQSTQNPEFAPLSGIVAFGSINLDRNACTLCMACVSVCPAQALSAGNQIPQLKFIESQCLQCGICQQACPEQAIDLQSRFVFDSVKVRQLRLLHEEKPFYCIHCKKPFATESMIHTILQKLQHHPMFLGEKKQQLLLCEDCKVAALFDK
jgi:ferredoxin